MRLHNAVAADKAAEPPTLARVMCASPFDAAIHDAVGIVLGRSAFALYDRPFDAPTADACFEGGLASERIARLIAPPRANSRPGTSSARTIRPKRSGRGWSIAAFATLRSRRSARTVPRTRPARWRFRLAQELGVKSPVISIDANEGNPNANRRAG